MKKLLITAVCTLAMTVSAQAAEWNFYGTAIVETFYSDTDNVTTSSSNNFELGLSAESVIGAQIKVSDTLSAVFEYGTDGGVADVRYLYGVWDFGAGSLEVGKDDGTLALPGSDQVYAEDAGLGGWGEMSSARKAQIRLIFGGFQIAFREPDATYNDGASNISDDTETTLPSIEAKYTLEGDRYNVMVNAGYHRFEVGDEDITSYVVGLGADYSIGAVTLAGSIFGGQNVGNLVDADVNGEDTGAGYAQYTGSRVIDNDALAYKVVLSYAFSDTLAVQGGYGYMKTELDDASEDEVQSYYLQVPVTLASGVSVVPEAGVVDYKQDTDGSKVTYIGAKWQIEF